ncbi:MAG: hypothetical protein Q7R56_03015 [Nanoarchaeota archaeon]|nr:hypothetical protein [Nanoarchaeota archaeon]
MGEKRGQLSIYVIIGILILASVILVLYLKPPGKIQEGISGTTSVPAQLQNVEASIQGCLEQVTKEAINLISIQGGYLNLEQPIPTIIDPFSNSLSTVTGGIPTAYWYYEQANGIAKTQQPTLTNIQHDIETYINEHIAACIPYQQYQYDGYEFNTANPVSIVTIGDNNILVTLTYPITITYKEQTFQLNKQTITLPTALGKLFKTAQQTYTYLEKKLLLENKTLDFMIVYKEIPYSGVDFNCQPKTWSQQQVYHDLKEIIAINLPYIKPAGGAHTITDKYYVQKELPVPKDVNINFQYNKQWPLDMQIHGHENDQALQGEPYTTNNKLSGILMPIFCLNQYHFVYTVKYPVLITITQGDEQFQFAYEVIIDHNQPRQAIIQPVTTTEPRTNNILCNANQQELTIYTLSSDEQNNYQPLPGAQLQFQCADNTCDLGTTDNDGTLTANIAACENGVITAEKQGYFTGTSIITSTASGSISVSMNKIYEKKINVLVQQQGTRNLEQNEQAIIRFQHNEESYSTSVIIPGSETIQLLPGTYTITSYLLNTEDSGLTIPAKTIKTCVDVPQGGLGILFGTTEKKCEEQTIPATTIDTMITGGNDYEFTITPYDLEHYKTLQFTIPYLGQPRTYEAITNIQAKIKKSPGIQPQWQE